MKRIIVLFSGSASSLRYLIENDPNYGIDYEIILVISNKKGTRGEEFCKRNNIPFQEVNSKQFCVHRGYEGQLKHMPESLRADYYHALLDLIEPHDPDLLILSGFMLQITEPLLGYYPILNVHPADLRILGEDNKPKYRGDNAVKMQFEAGEKETASTIHFVEKELDCGKIVCISDPLPITQGTSWQEHQERMKNYCDGPAYQKALSEIEFNYHYL